MVFTLWQTETDTEYCARLQCNSSCLQLVPDDLLGRLTAEASALFRVLDFKMNHEAKLSNAAEK